MVAWWWLLVVGLAAFAAGCMVPLLWVAWDARRDRGRHELDLINAYTAPVGLAVYPVMRPTAEDR